VDEVTIEAVKALKNKVWNRDMACFGKWESNLCVGCAGLACFFIAAIATCVEKVWSYLGHLTTYFLTI